MPAGASNQEQHHPADNRGMSQVDSAPSGRWLAALCAICGLIALAGLAARGAASLPLVFPASAMFLGGAAVYLRMTARPRAWARAMNGPEARVFFAVCLASFLILALAGLILVLRLLNALPF